MALSICPELVEKYPDVPRDEVFDAVEVSVIRVMQQLHRHPASAIIDDEGIHVSLFKDNGASNIDLAKVHRKAKRRLLNEIEIELMKRQACYEAEYFRTIRGAVITGSIQHINATGTLVVQFEFNDVLRPIQVYAECPVVQQPVHERQRYTAGTALSFMVASCIPVSDGRRAKVRVIASRVARELPSRMLANLTGLPGIRCKKRVPGGYSQIISIHQLPKAAVNTVGKELREHLEIICPLHPGKPFTRRLT